ncbi:formylglycine-generating enzyme family protein [Pendulispora rubella]|uniref:Formylglycine-generating enzyme family protein n=1 Tax=Pendulispora rubella TaxID=2741070 RepID=A0ABZ2LFA0_9BACT
MTRWKSMLGVAFVALPFFPRTAPQRKPVEAVRIEGEFCPQIEQHCLRWLPNTDEVKSAEPLRCAEFAPSVCKTKTRHMAFYMDRYEYPGRAGELPMVDITWPRAEKLCAGRGKRLCTAEEWMLACEGDKILPYPYGHTRDASACHIDAPLRPPGSPTGRSAPAHWRTPIDQREPSGSRPRCASPFGVFDMTGNVDEWVDGRASGHASSSMGGYWGPVRNRCRVVTRAHDEHFSFYQTGFRCCSDTE